MTFLLVVACQACFHAYTNKSWDFFNAVSIVRLVLSNVFRVRNVGRDSDRSYSLAKTA